MTKLLSRPIFHILPRRLQSRNYFWSKSAPATSEAVSHVEPNLTNTPNTLNESMQSLAKEPLQSDSFSSLGNSAVDVSKSSIDASLIQPASDLITKIAQIGDLSSLGFCSAYTPKGWMEMLLEASHVYSGLQWGGSIILGTVILRLVLLPVSIKAQRAIVKMKDFKPLMTVYQEKSKSLKASGKIQDATLINQELFMEMKGKGINPFAGLWGIFQIPLFISFFLGLRAMADLPVPGFKDGGFLWFTDLSLADPYYVLPFLGGMSLLLAMEANKAMPMTDGGKLALRIVSILSIGAFSFLPTAVLLFSITSGGLTLLQTVLFQTDGVKRILKLENNPELARDKHGKLHLAPEASENNSMLKFKPLSFMEARKAIKEHLMEVVDPADKTSIAGKVLDPKPINLKAFVKDSSSNGKSDVDVSKTTATPAPKPQPNTKSQQKHKAQHNQPQKTHKKKNKKNLSSDKKSK